MALTTDVFLRQERDRIISEWERAVRMEPRTIPLEDSALRSDLPQFIDELAAWMKSEEAPAGGMLRFNIAAHVGQRLRNAYELSQLVEEYRVLRMTILRLLLGAEAAEQSRGGAGGMDRRVLELARLNAGLDRAISEAVERFVGERERIRERFMGIMSHDLRAPIGNILTNADLMLRSGQLPPGLDRSAARIARNAERMGRMVADLLDLARGRLGGGIPITPVRADMSEVCHAVVDELRITHPSRTITVDTDGPCWGEWDRDRAFQAVGNLVANALQYGRDPVTITANGAADEVVVAVTNQGATIPHDRVSNLFDPFQRGEGGGTRGEGLGLGLYIVSEIMRAHGGSVAVESSEERGTKFTLRWPMKKSQRAPSLST